MAWSDAAKKAAAEVRQMHAQVKQGWTSGHWRSPERSSIFNKAYRKVTADRLREARKGNPVFVLGHKASVRMLTDSAARSTFYRNVARAFDRRERAWADAQHPRVPAGNSRGGQFTKK